MIAVPVHKLVDLEAVLAFRSMLGRGSVSCFSKNEPGFDPNKMLISKWPHLNLCFNPSPQMHKIKSIFYSQFLHFGYLDLFLSQYRKFCTGPVSKVAEHQNLYLPTSPESG
jgi:hypothetical protein